MARYSVATTKDNLSKLIDKALAGEEVVITRHGKASVRLVPESLPELLDVKRANFNLRQRLAAIPQIVNDGRPLMDQIKDEYKY